MLSVRGNMQDVLDTIPVLCSIGIAVCSASVILNIWIFFLLRNLRTLASSSGAVTESGRVYNLTLIRHLLLTDVITAVLIVMDLVLRAHGGQHSAPNLPAVPKEYFQLRNVSLDNSSRQLVYSMQLPASLPPLPAAKSPPISVEPWNESKPMPGYNCFRYFSSKALYSSHALTLIALTLIAVDLYIFVIRALSYRSAFIVRCLPKLLMASWLSCLCIATIPMAYHAALTARLPSINNTVEYPYIHYYCRFGTGLMDRFCCVGHLAMGFNSLQIVLAVFLASCCVITFCYSRIVLTICRLAASTPGSASSNSIATTVRQNVRGVATSVGLLLLFYALFLPYFTLLLRTNLIANEDRAETLLMDNDYLSDYVEVAMSTYTLFNPLVYACRLRAVRRRSSRTLAQALLSGRRRTRDSAALHQVQDGAGISHRLSLTARHSRSPGSLQRGRGLLCRETQPIQHHQDRHQQQQRQQQQEEQEHSLLKSSKLEEDGVEQLEMQSM